MNRLRITVLFLVLALLVSGMTQAQEEQVLVIGHAEVADSLDPHIGYNQTTNIINKATYDTLVTFPAEDASEILPGLATDWTVSEDGLVYTFNLRDDVLFSTGNPLTADDVVFSINRLKNLQSQPSFMAGETHAKIAGVEAVDDDTVEITVSQANPALLSILANNAFSVVDADVVREQGGTDAEDAAEVDTAEEFLNQTSVGTGPYILESWEPQVQTVLVRNPNYWGEPAFFDRIIVQAIPEAVAQKAALEAGDIDLALDLTADQAAALEGVEGVTVVESPANIVHFLLLNRNEEQCGPTADPRVAEAVRLALDYPGYLELWGGITPAAPTGVALYTGYGPEFAEQRDLDAARALLAEAGYADGLDLVLEYPTFTFQGVNMDTNAQKIQSDLAEAGINVTLEPSEVQVALEEYRTGQECFGYWFWGPDVLDPLDALAFIPGGKVATERALWLPEDAAPEIMELREQALVETDPEARAEIFRQIYDYLLAEGAFAPFSQPSMQAAFDANLEGYVWHPSWILDVAELSLAE